MIDITSVVASVIALVVALITTFLLPWMKTKISTEKLIEISEWATIAVKAAEMIYNQAGMGQKKKEYVEKFLAEKGFKLDAKTIDALIEASVLELKAEGAEIK